MIIITTNKNDFQFKYRGNIELKVHGEFLIAEGIVTDPMSFEAYSWGLHVWDKFWLDDIKSITGVNE